MRCAVVLFSAKIPPLGTMTDSHEKKRKRKDPLAPSSDGNLTTDLEKISKVLKRQRTQTDPASSSLPQAAGDLGKQERKEARAEKRRRKEEKRLRKAAKVAKRAVSTTQKAPPNTTQTTDVAVTRPDVTNGSSKDASSYPAAPSTAIPQANPAAITVSKPARPSEKKSKKSKPERSLPTISDQGTPLLSAQQKEVYNWETLRATPSTLPSHNAEASSSDPNTTCSPVKGKRPASEKKQDQLVKMDHTEILASKWLKTPALKALAEEDGKIGSRSRE
jgi:hypothetical protein